MQKKAVGRLHHPPPDGFAKLLGGENFGSSIPALHFGGKTAPTRPFHGYARLRGSGCLSFDVFQSVLSVPGLKDNIGVLLISTR